MFRHDDDDCSIDESIIAAQFEIYTLLDFPSIVKWNSLQQKTTCLFFWVRQWFFPTYTYQTGLKKQNIKSATYNVFEICTMFWWEMALLSSALNCDALLWNLTKNGKKRPKPDSWVLLLWEIFVNTTTLKMHIDKIKSSCLWAAFIYGGHSFTDD